MGLLSVLFGRNKLRKADREQFFSIITASVSLAGRTDMRLTDKAGVVFNPVESRFFEDLDSELRDLLRISGQSTGTRYEIKDDGHGTRWAIKPMGRRSDRYPESGAGYLSDRRPIGLIAEVQYIAVPGFRDRARRT